MSLRWKIAMGLAAIAALVSAFCATGAYVTTSRQVRNGIDDSLTSRSAAVRDSGRDGPGSRPVPESPECPPPGLLEPASAAQLVAADGTTVSQCLSGAVTLPINAGDRALARQGGSDRLRTVTVGGREYRMLTAALAGGGALQTARGLDEMQSVLSSLAFRLVVIGIVGTIAAALLGWFLARRIVRPIDDLRDTAERIARTQDLDVPIPTTAGGEVGSLATSFSTMVDRLGTSRRQQRQLIADAGHELRTPLTSLRTNAELIERDLLDAGQRRSAAKGIQVEVEELTSLVGELVELATDQSANVEETAPVVLADVASEVCELARRRSGRTIIVDASSDEPVIARPQMMHRAITNLVDNALKYAADGSPIDVVVGRARLEVLDRGPGIAVEDQAHVFERFYRAASARTEPGSGLGLAIVAQIVERHGGTVWARNRDHGPGAAVGFDLPG